VDTPIPLAQQRTGLFPYSYIGAPADSTGVIGVMSKGGFADGSIGTGDALPGTASTAG
jgi:hypothetical protein